jgi:hypothetical protein
VDTKLKIVLLVPLLAVGIVSFVIVRSQQGQGAALIARQQGAEALTPAKVAGLVRLAPASVAGEPGRSATCVPLGSGELHNPWRCTIDYRSGRVIHYRVTLNADGSYTGDHQIVRYRGRTSRGTGAISGCCVVIP